MALATSLETRVSPSMGAYARNSAALSDIRVRLTTGNRIVRLGDDAASLVTANGLQSQTSTLRSALVSGAKATSFLQVAAGGLSQIREVLETMSTLTAEANASGRTSRQFATLDGQFQSQLAAIDAIVAATIFGGASILDGSADGTSAPAAVVGELAADTVALAIPDVSTGTLFGGPVAIGNTIEATAATTSVSTAQQTVADAIAKIDAYQVRLDTANQVASRSISGLALGLDQLIGTDDAAETRNETFLTLRQDTAAALLAQTLGANGGLLGLLQRA